MTLFSIILIFKLISGWCMDLLLCIWCNLQKFSILLKEPKFIISSKGKENVSTVIIKKMLFRNL